jgi:hypothetical protein
MAEAWASEALLGEETSSNQKQPLELYRREN